MHAVVANAPGGPDELRWLEVAEPRMQRDEVLLDVAATAVNRADVLQRQGRYPPPPGESEYLGLECSGTIAAVGADVVGWGVGDQVCALLAGGGYAQRVAVPAGQLLRIPAGMDLVTAAALPEVACTVWSNLMMVGRLRRGQTVLVHGGSGGVGSMAIQVANAVGARVATTAGGPAKLSACADLGASVLIDHTQEDFVAVVKAATGGRGADLVLDIMGASYLPRNLAALAVDGILVIIGLQGGRRSEIELGTLLAKRATIAGTTLRARPREQKQAVVTAVGEHLWPLLESGEVHPVIDRVVSISDVAAAHRAVEAGEHVGKIVLRIA